MDSPALHSLSTTQPPSGSLAKHVRCPPAQATARRTSESLNGAHLPVMAPRVEELLRGAGAAGCVSRVLPAECVACWHAPLHLARISHCAGQPLPRPHTCTGRCKWGFPQPERTPWEKGCPGEAWEPRRCRRLRWWGAAGAQRQAGKGSGHPTPAAQRHCGRAAGNQPHAPACLCTGCWRRWAAELCWSRGRKERRADSQFGT